MNVSWLIKKLFTPNKALSRVLGEAFGMPVPERKWNDKDGKLGPMRASNLYLTINVNVPLNTEAMETNRSYHALLYLIAIPISFTRKLPVGAWRIPISSNQHFKLRWVNFAMEMQHLSLNDLTHEIEQFNAIIWKENQWKLYGLCFSLNISMLRLSFLTIFTKRNCVKS